MAYIDGVPASPDQLRALALLNYGHFTSMRADAQRVRGLSHHLDRLASHCLQLFAADLDREWVRSLVRDAVASQGSESAVVRVTIFDPTMDLGRPWVERASPVVLVTTRPAGPAYPGPFRVRSVTYQRDLPEVKHIGLMGPLWQRRHAQRNGFDDALFSDRESFISEGPTWNVAFHDGGRLIWPQAPVLEGVTMRLLQQVHDQSVIRPVNLRDIPMMRAAFATNTTIGVRPIAAIDSVELPIDTEMLQFLRKEYEEIPPERI